MNSSTGFGFPGALKSLLAGLLVNAQITAYYGECFLKGERITEEEYKNIINDINKKYENTADLIHSPNTDDNDDINDLD